MREEPRDTEGAPAGGVFGKLPDSRPGSRSPRRDSSRRKDGGEPKAAGRKAARTAPRRPVTPLREGPRRDAGERAAEPPPPPDAAPEPDAAAGTGLDDIAWAGVAAVAEAATFGVRLANRAFGALRGADESDDTDDTR